MRLIPSRPRAMQLRLFQPPLKRPYWDDLPAEIQRQAVGLLARLLREHWLRALTPARQEGVSDE